MLTDRTRSNILDRSASVWILFYHTSNTEVATFGANWPSRSEHLQTQVEDVEGLFASETLVSAVSPLANRPNRVCKAARAIDPKKIAGPIDYSTPGADRLRTHNCDAERINRLRSIKDAGRAVKNAPDNSAIELTAIAISMGLHRVGEVCLKLVGEP